MKLSPKQHRRAETKESCGCRQCTTLKRQYQSSRGKRDPGTDRHHRQRHRQHCEQEWMWRSGQDISDTDNSALHDRSCHGPVHCGAGCICDFTYQARAGVSEQALSGGERAICQPCAVAKHQKQRDQRNHE
jgi:hypothetical protein